jgi:hypothetical protein
MNAKSRSWIKPVAVTLAIGVFWIVCLPVPSFLFAPYDASRLAWFAHRIAGTDHIVGTRWMSSVSVTITGDDAKKVVAAISSAGSGRPPCWGMEWANSYGIKAKFYRGTKVLGEIVMDGGGLFLIHHHQPPFLDGTGLLHDLLCQPVIEAAHEAEMKKLESQ